MVTFVKSVDTVNDNLLSDFIGVANASVDSLETVASTAITERGALVASIDSLELVTGGNTAALEASVDSLEGNDDVLAEGIQAVRDDLDGYTVNANASIDSLELVDTALSNAITTNASDISDNGAAIGNLQASVDSLEIAEDNAIASIDSLEGIDTGLAADIAANALYLHQFGAVASPTEFVITTNVRFGANDDLKVSVNGHVLHPAAEGFADGYATADGARFDVSAIGYTLDAGDHVYVIGIQA